MKKVIWLLFSFCLLYSSFGQKQNHTVKITSSKNSSKNIEVEIVYHKKSNRVHNSKQELKVKIENPRFLIKRKDKSNNSIFTFNSVDTAPVFLNCNIQDNHSPKQCFKLGISKFIQDNFQYPEKAIEDGTTGIVFIKFTVNKQGKVVNVDTTDENDSDILTKYCQRLLLNMPKLMPAYKNGKTVEMSYAFQLNFSL